MTPEQKIKYLILVKVAEWEGKAPPEFIADHIERAYDDLDDCYDAMSELREGEVETHLSCQSSRHYESKAVAAQLPDGSWVGWTFWFGGGKHGEPEAIDWMNTAYDLICTEKEKMVIVRTFSVA